MGTIQIDGSTPKITVGNATAEDATILFDGNAKDFYIALDDSEDDLVIGLGSTVGTTPAISINEDRDVTISDGAIDFDIASHDTSNGLKLGGTLVTATAAELNIMDGVTSTAAEINLIDGGTARGTTAIADGDGILVNDAGTMRMTTVETLSTYIGGFDVSSITGATDLAAIPDNADEFVLSDGGTLKRMDYKYLVPFNSLGGCFSMGAQDDITTATYVKLLLDTTVYNRGLTFGSSTITIPAGGDGDYFVSVFLQPSTGGEGRLGQASGTIYLNGSGTKYFNIDFRRTSATSEYHSKSATVSWTGVLNGLNATDTIELYAYIIHNESTDTSRKSDSAMVTIIKINNE